LPTAGKDWHAYEDAITRCASSPDLLNVLRLADTLTRCSDDDLVKSLSRTLCLRAGVSPIPASRPEVAKAVRKALGATSPAAASTAADRWLALRERADAALARPAPAAGDQSELLRQTVELAHLATMAMALAQGEAGFAFFDAGMTEPPELTKRGSSKGESDEEAEKPIGRASRPIGASDRKNLERFSTMLGGFARQQPAQRVTALRGLADVGDAAPDISQAQAEDVAKYLLCTKGDEEHAEVLRSLVAVRHWKRLRLAVADLVPHSQLTPDQQQQLSAAILGHGAAGESSSADVMRRLLRESVLADLSESASRADTRADDPLLVLDSAAELLAETFRQRARNFGASGPELLAANSPARALDLSLRPLADSLRGSVDDGAYLASFGHAHKAAMFLAGDDLRRTVAIQRLLVELSTRRALRHRPQQAAAARQIETESLAAISKSDSALVQLRNQEAALLQLWMLYAPEI
jgi:hypothetical protein